MLCQLCQITCGKMVRHLQTVHKLSQAAAAIQANMWAKENTFDEAVAAVRRTKLKSVNEAANLAEVRESLHASTRQLVQVDASASQFAEEWGRVRQFLLSDVGGAYAAATVNRMRRWYRKYGAESNFDPARTYLWAIDEIPKLDVTAKTKSNYLDFVTLVEKYLRMSEFKLCLFILPVRV